MNQAKLRKTAQTLALTILSSLCLNLNAEAPTYRVEKAEYINSSEGSVEALCNPGDELVDGSCEGSYRGISATSPFIDYPLDTESLSGGYRCKPRILRHDQIVMVIVEATCKPGKSAKLAQYR